MGSEAGGALARQSTDEQRLLALLDGRHGDPEFDHRLYRSNIRGEELEELGTVEGAAVSLSNFRDHTWELSLSMREAGELDVFEDFVKLVILLRDPQGPWPGGWRRFPFGLYWFRSPRGTDGPLSTVWDLTGRSPEALLLDDRDHNGYGAPAGTGVLAEVRRVLLSRGIPASRIGFPTRDEALATDFFADPYNNAEGTRHLRICNALLAAGGFYALWTDNEGRFTTRAIEEAGPNAPDVVYGTEAGSEKMVVGEVPFEYDEEGFANRVVVHSGDSGQSPPVVGVAELRNRTPQNPEPGVVYLVDPDSRVAVDATAPPRVVQGEPEQVQNLASPEAARKLARARLRVSARLSLKRELSTLVDPRRKPRETYGLRLRREDGRLVEGASLEWPVVGFTLPLDLTGMSHEITRGIRA